MNPTTNARELISALADGQLADEDLAVVLAACDADDEALAGWDSYHLIGDVLRSPDLAPQVSDAAFLQGLRSRLAEEPAIPAVAAVSAQPLPIRIAHEAANDSRWKLVAGLASLAAVLAVTWNTGAGWLAPPEAPQLVRAETPQQVLVMSGQGPVVRDARLQELLAEHKQFGGTSALQMPSGFLRNATFEVPPGQPR